LHVADPFHIIVVYTTIVDTTNTIKLEHEIKQERFKDESGKAVINVLVTADRVSSGISSLLKPFGVSSEQYNVLRILRGQYPEPSTLSLITERMISKTSNSTRLVEKLRQKKLVERNQCDENRRRVDILITRQGLTLLEELDPIMDESNRRMRNLTVKETKELNRLLDKMRG